MGTFIHTSYQRDFDQNFLISKQDRNRCWKFDFLKEPNKYLPFGESTYSDHFGPKTNFPPPCTTGPIPIPLVYHRAKHLVTTTQQDYDGRKVGTFTGNIFKYGTKPDSLSRAPVCLKERPDEVLSTVGPIPLVKTCRRQQTWETTYSSDYEYHPPKERLFPFPQ